MRTLLSSCKSSLCHMPDQAVASILNRSGKSTGRRNSWTSSRVSSLRRVHGIELYREGKRAERGEVTIDEAATALSVSHSTILRMVREGTLPGHQLCKGAPWIIGSQDLERQDVKDDASAGGRDARRPTILGRKALICKELISMRSMSPLFLTQRAAKRARCRDVGVVRQDRARM
jgi:excisionase family DNA binding protein